MGEEDRKNSLRMISFSKILANKLSPFTKLYRGELRASSCTQVGSRYQYRTNKNIRHISHLGNNLWGVYQRHITNDFCILVTLLFTIADRIVQDHKILILACEHSVLLGGIICSEKPRQNPMRGSPTLCTPVDKTNG